MAVSPADLAAWWKLFCLIDEGQRGCITTAQMVARMAPMVGAFEWTDENDDGTMDFSEFLATVHTLPSNKRHCCLLWAQQYCPDKTGGRPVPSLDPAVLSAAARANPMPRGAAPPSEEEERAAWLRLFLFIADRQARISRSQMVHRMAPMVGSFVWEDSDDDGAMDFEEFVACMRGLPAQTRHTCLLWAQNHCPV
eukprot:EG_transcript_20073